ncbi:MAG: efflux RND transporter periplasmic adaptor subunit [Pseudomonadota bacterium]|nr:efflux RND transporter periplasmic adaptor subunit [Pseudomonadota bacterium]
MSSLRRLPFLLPPLLLGGVLVARAVRPVEVRGMQPTTGEVAREVLGIGFLESEREVPLGFELGGRILDLAVEEGDAVSIGQTVATLDITDASRDLAVSRAGETLADASLRRASAEVDVARTTAALATQDLQRADLLFHANVIPSAEYEAFAGRADTTRANLAAAEAAMDQARSSRAIAGRTSASRAARVQDGVLTSPLAGIAVERHVEVGQVVAAGAPVFTLVATERLRIRAWVDESALGVLSIGQPARIALRSNPGETFLGQVERVGHQVDRQTHELLVDVAVLTRPEGFAVGQRADVWIGVERRVSALRIPRGACDETAGRCLVERGGRATRVPVRFGVVGTAWSEVLEGLAPTDRVLPPDEITDGRSVRLSESP